MGPPLQTGALLALLQPYHMTSKEPGCLLQGCRRAVYVQPKIGIKSSSPIRGERTSLSGFFSAPLLHLVVEKLNVSASQDVFSFCYINNLRLWGWKASQPGAVVWAGLVRLSIWSFLSSIKYTKSIAVILNLNIFQLFWSRLLLSDPNYSFTSTSSDQPKYVAPAPSIQQVVVLFQTCSLANPSFLSESVLYLPIQWWLDQEMFFLFLFFIIKEDFLTCTKWHESCPLTSSLYSTLISFRIDLYLD